MPKNFLLRLAVGSMLTCVLWPVVPANAQLLSKGDQPQFGLQVPPDVDQITSRALNYLKSNQLPAGNWKAGHDSHSQGRENCGVTGLALMALLSTGDDPNIGPYATNIRAAIRYLIKNQNPNTGFLPNTMYNHGFGMLGLAEAYGVVDESLLWSDDASATAPNAQRKLGQTLQLAVDCAIKSQARNPHKAWRYGPVSKDADSSVTGAILVGLLGARNAGIPVSDSSLKDAFEYLKALTAPHSGETAYTLGINALTGGPNLSAITVLTAAIGHQPDSDQAQSAATFIKKFIDQVDNQFPYYNMYYMAQALFQSDYEAWSRWNQITIRRLRRKQKKDGSFDSQHGEAYATSMACLALALNYRFLPIYER